MSQYNTQNEDRENCPFLCLTYDDNLNPRSTSPWPRSPSISRKGLLLGNLRSSKSRRGKACRNRSILIVCILLVLGVVAALVWFSLVITLIRRLAPREITNGLQLIVNSWHIPNDSMALLSPWPNDFSRDITTIPCHSHNDYWRHVPLYNALAVGCMSVEADIWLRKDNNGNDDLFVGHSPRSLKQDRTLQSLYVNPILNILENQNTPSKHSTSEEKEVPIGIFDASPNTTLVLLLDFKSNGTELWPHVNAQLEPFRQKGWLTYWNSTTDIVTAGPITIVGTGNTPFEAVISNTTYRDIFFDAPLDDIANPRYNTTNSYYASASISQAVGKIWFDHLSSKQLGSIKSQIAAASEKQLISRYWGTIGWPISWRDHIWNVLVQNKVGMLNVDDLVSASRWNWDWCTIAGLVLCG